MTAIADNVGRRKSRPRAGMDRLRSVVWALHLMVGVLAVFSLFTNRFDLWVDLRRLGGVGIVITKIVWVGTVLVVPWCSGPRLTGLRAGAWVNGGWSAAWARRLLWPTYFLIACLIVNTVSFYQMLHLGVLETDIPVPITLLAAGLLAAWVIATREWLRRGGALPVRTAVARAKQILGAAFAGLCILVIGGFFLLHVYARPPRQKVDLAVVLGNRVLPDGTASGVLRDRALAAINLYKRGLVDHLFLSGDVRPSQTHGPLRNEPLAMLQVCLQNGVPERDITLDPYGVNTRASAFNARRYMQARGMKTVAACSDDYHLIRCAMSFAEQGIAAYTVPSHRQDWPCADVEATLREIAAICVYRFDRSYRAPKEVPMQLNMPQVVVRKSANALEISEVRFGQRTLVKTYACITGRAAGDKNAEGDHRTPVGVFHIVYKNPNSKFHLSLGLDYPNAQDAARGLQQGLISREQYDGIMDALKSDLTLAENQKKLWYTPLGGEIFIHGYAAGRSGTAGCVAVANPDIEEIYAALPLGTRVEIVP